MADEIKRKRVTLHPLKKDGTLDLYTNLYPKCLNTGIVDENGNEVKVLTTEGGETFDQAIARLQDEIDEKGDVTSEELAQAVANKAEITLIELNDLMSEETIASMGGFLIGWTELTYNIWYFNKEIDLSELKDETFIGFHYVLHGDDESIISDTLLLFTKEYCTNDEPVFVLNRLSPTINVSHLSLTLASNGIIGLQQLHTDAASHWGNITGNIQEQSDLQAALNNKQDTIADLDTIRSGAAAGAAAVSQDDFNNAIDEIDNHITVIAENQLPCWNLSFSLKSSSYQTNVPQPDDEPWMRSEDTYDNQPIILSINGGAPEFCFISKTIEGDHNDHIYITLYNSRWYIEMTYIPSEVQFEWTLDLSGYFGNKIIRDDFYPAIRFIDNEWNDDNVIMPSWVQDIDTRMRMLTRIEVPAILYTDDNNVGEPVTIYAIPDVNTDDQVVVHIRSSEGDYKLTYQYHEDEEGE